MQQQPVVAALRRAMSPRVHWDGAQLGACFIPWAKNATHVQCKSNIKSLPGTGCGSFGDGRDPRINPGIGGGCDGAWAHNGHRAGKDRSQRPAVLEESCNQHAVDQLAGRALAGTLCIMQGAAHGPSKVLQKLHMRLQGGGDTQVPFHGSIVLGQLQGLSAKIAGAQAQTSRNQPVGLQDRLRADMQPASHTEEVRGRPVTEKAGLASNSCCRKH